MKQWNSARVQPWSTLDSLDATGAVSDIPQKDRVRVAFHGVSAPFSQDHEMDHGMDEHYDDHNEHDDHDSDDHFDPEDFDPRGGATLGDMEDPVQWQMGLSENVGLILPMK